MILICVEKIVALQSHQTEYPEQKLIAGWSLLTNSRVFPYYLNSLKLKKPLIFELNGRVAFGHLASGSETENWKSDFNPINLVFIGKLIGRSHAVKIESYESYCTISTVSIKRKSRARLRFCKNRYRRQKPRI